MQKDKDGEVAFSEDPHYAWAKTRQERTCSLQSHQQGRSSLQVRGSGGKQRKNALQPCQEPVQNGGAPAQGGGTGPGPDCSHQGKWEEERSIGAGMKCGRDMGCSLLPLLFSEFM